MGLLNKIFGGGDGGSEDERAERASEVERPLVEDAGAAATRGANPSHSTIRPASEVLGATREPRAARRPEHPRVSLRSSPAHVEPTVAAGVRRASAGVAAPTVRLPDLDVAALARAGRAPGSERSIPRRSDVAPRSTPTPRPPPFDPSQPRSVVVVTPNSLTPEQLAVPPSGRRMPTLLGLGAALDASREAAVEHMRRAAERKAKAKAAREGASEPQGAGDAADAVTPSSAADVAARESSAATLDGGAAEPVATSDARGAVPSRDERIAAAELLADYTFRLSFGPVTAAWTAAAREATATLLCAASAEQQSSLATQLERLLPVIERGSRERVLSIAWRLGPAVPDWPVTARDVRDSARRREQRIVTELCSAFDGLRLSARTRLVQTRTLEQLVELAPEGLAEELGCPIERAVELRQHCDRYAAERRARGLDVGHRAAIANALSELERACLDFEALDEEQTEERRAVRQRRRDAQTRVNLLLAERGELELLDALEPLTYARRAELLRELFPPVDTTILPEAEAEVAPPVTPSTSLLSAAEVEALSTTEAESLSAADPTTSEPVTVDAAPSSSRAEPSAGASLAAVDVSASDSTASDSAGSDSAPSEPPALEGSVPEPNGSLQARLPWSDVVPSERRD